MENFGDWIYVIILAIAGISSIISSFRKNAKKAAEEAQEQTQPHEVTLGDVFDDDFWGNDGQTQEPQVINPAPAYKSKYKPIEQQQYNFNQHQEGVSSFKPNKEDSILLETEDVYTTVTLEDLPRDTDDWRKAFVYNEIFNRKY